MTRAKVAAPWWRVIHWSFIHELWMDPLVGKTSIAFKWPPWLLRASVCLLARNIEKNHSRLLKNSPNVSFKVDFCNFSLPWVTFFQFKTKRIKTKAVCQSWYFYPVMLKIKWLLGLKMGYDGLPGYLTTESGWVRFQPKKLLADSNSGVQESMSWNVFGVKFTRHKIWLQFPVSVEELSKIYSNKVLLVKLQVRSTTFNEIQLAHRVNIGMDDILTQQEQVAPDSFLKRW